MDMVLICRDALEDSVLGNVALALEAAKAGRKVGVLFTGEALAALAGSSFNWSPLFKSRDARIRISRGATAAGLEFSNAKDARWTDLPRLLTSAEKAGVALVADPIWSDILGAAGKLPPEIKPMDRSTLMKTLGNARTVIGGM